MTRLTQKSKQKQINAILQHGHGLRPLMKHVFQVYEGDLVASELELSASAKECKAIMDEIRARVQQRQPPEPQLTTTVTDYSLSAAAHLSPVEEEDEMQDVPALTITSSTTAVTKQTELVEESDCGDKSSSSSLFLSNVMSLKVNDLKKALRARGQDTTGLKKELQDRLLEILELEQQQQPVVEEKKESETAIDEDAVMEETCATATSSGSAARGAITTTAIELSQVNKSGEMKDGENAPGKSRVSGPPIAQTTTAMIVTTSSPTGVVSKKYQSVNTAKVKSPPKVSEETTSVEKYNKGAEFVDASFQQMQYAAAPEDLEVAVVPALSTEPESAPNTTTTSTTGKDRSLMKHHYGFSKMISTSSSRKNAPQSGSNNNKDEHMMMELDSGRKRSRSPVQMVQSTLGKLSINKSPLRKLAKVVDAQPQKNNSNDKNNAPVPPPTTTTGPPHNISINTSDETTAEESVRPSAPVMDMDLDNNSKSHHHRPDAKIFAAKKVDSNTNNGIANHPMTGSMKGSRIRKLLAEPPVKFSAPSSSFTSKTAHSGSSLLSAESMEARKANMADKMRAKTKPAVKPLPTPNLYEKTLTSLKSTGNQLPSEQNKRKEMDAKIRLKAFGNQTQGQPTVPEMTKKPFDFAIPALQPTSTSAAKSKPPPSSANTAATQKSSAVHASAQKTAPSKKYPMGFNGNTDHSKGLPTLLPISALKASSKSSAKAVASSGGGLTGPVKISAKTPPSPRSPMDTYDISDNDGDSDSEEERSPKQKKRIPEWAQKAALQRALTLQFSVGRNFLDPDEIFGEVLTCDLEQVFERSKHRYKKRTSSGLWTNDRLTETERRAYKQFHNGSSSPAAH